MALSELERRQIESYMRSGHTASAAVPFLQDLVRSAQEERIPDLVDAIRYASENMEVNRRLGVQFLAHRVPAILTNVYWPERYRTKREMLRDIVRYTARDDAWSRKVVEALIDGDRERLLRAVQGVEERARREQ